MQDEQRAQTRLALGAMLIPIFFVIGFAIGIIGVYHKPHLHDIAVRAQRRHVPRLGRQPGGTAERA